MSHYRKFIGIGAGFAAAVVGLAGPALAAQRESDRPAPAIERVVADTVQADPELADPELADPELADPELVGDLEIAMNSAAVAELASNVQVTATDLYLVGDSTFVAATGSIGFGSSFAGIGFAQSAGGVATVNPNLVAPQSFEGLVVIGVSLWDVGVDDLAAYRISVDTYRAAGYPVVVVEVPESYGHGPIPLSTPQQEAEFAALNAAVAEAVGCELQPWTLRDVETVGDIGEADDHAHPSSAGVDQLLTNLSMLAAHPCEAALHG